MTAVGRAVLVAVTLILAASAPGEEPLDPDDLVALLSDLEASGGILTADDLAALSVPAPPSARGTWSLALTGRSRVPPRLDLRAGRRSPRWSFRLRARRDGAGDLMAGWIHTSLSQLSVDLGGGALVHGAGLLAAPPGRRSSLSPDSPLLPPRPGWRPSTSTEPGANVLGGTATWTGTRADLAVGAARDQQGGRVAHLRGGVRWKDMHLAGLLLRRGQGRAWGLDLRWQAGDWRLAAETARWRRGPQEAPGVAWHLAAFWRRGHWRAEAQAAASDAPAGLEGAARPGCLPGWRGRGWAVRVSTRPSPGLDAALVCSRGAHRDPDAATGARGERALLALLVRSAAWELRLRRSDETRLRWDALQPWLPAAVDRRRQRTWLTLATVVPAAGGEARLAWRWLEEAGESRSLLAAIWTCRQSWGRWRGGVHLAWGDPLDLVAVSAPVPGLVRLRHWGHWRSGVLLGADGGGVWRWQCGGEARRRTPAAGGGLELEIHAGCGRSF